MSTHTAPMPLPIVAASRATSGLVMAVASALAFSASGPFLKPLLEAGWSLGAVLLVRMGVAGLVLSPALVRALRRDRSFVRRHGGVVIAFGLTAVAGCQLFYFAAMQRMPVAVALLIQYIAPVLIVLWVWARTRRAPSRAVVTGSVVAMTGLVLVVDIAGARFEPLGTLLALGAAICAAAYFVISERSGGRIAPLALASGGLLVGTALIGVLLLTGVLPFAAPPVTVVLAGMELPWWVPLGWVAAVGTTLGYALGVMAVPRTGARLASFVGLSEVLFTLLVAWIVLAEAPGAVQVLGGALVLAGVVLVRLDGASPALRRRPAVTAPGAPMP
ncbi:DMT family transporter [Microbacterium sp. zg.Y1090]|uniref:EamA family transporter n=1 Tax=Microbacterium TaxID=33882 RepID=UPI00214BA96C|nr:MULTISPECIES: DMT family transporter [unclassified Microbacterium]MCR2811985.1 DMT family transporter [Microbacterium sp. zg.Y1084]MCR2818576.1 DMT family transporter [Microbacterium sp. zg.Y1090]MDL5486389.1 DMT family transporter [Microbacterium sp. zg-Y1211]WIM29579.1 DMT family transporter [Microbacterium sp. zg-Y1090]